MIKIVGIEFIPRLGNCRPENGTGTFVEWSPMKYWRSVADTLSAAGWSWVIAAPLQSRVGDGGLLMRPKATANATLSNLMSS